MSWWVVPEGTIGEMVGDLVGIAKGTLAVGSAVHVVSASARPASAVAGPYDTQAEAQAEANSINEPLTAATSGSNNPVNQAATGALGWNLSLSGFTGWFLRGLKILFGGVLIILAVSHLTGLSNKITQTAGSAVPVLASAA